MCVAGWLGSVVVVVCWEICGNNTHHPPPPHKPTPNARPQTLSPNQNAPAKFPPELAHRPAAPSRWVRVHGNGNGNTKIPVLASSFAPIQAR